MRFKSGKKASLGGRLRNLIWPRMGFKRTLKFYKLRLVRIDDTAYSIAAGLAFGCAISFTPAFGTHLIQCMLFCWLMRVNFFASFIGTAFGNPITFPILWTIGGTVGITLFQLCGLDWFLEGFYFPENLESFWDLPFKFLIPIMFGGYLCAIISYPFFYYSFVAMIRAARAARVYRLKSRIHKAVKDVTGQET